MRIILGVSGGIAAYKAVLALRLLTEAGHQVRVIPTEAALAFVGRPTWEALSHQPVTTSVFDGTDTVDHVRLGREADLVIVAPATADLLARAATGRADDLLTATLLTVHCPVLIAPAMHTEMWHHPATRDNVATLRRHGAHVLDPDSGRLTGADTGPGRLPEPAVIVAAALALVHRDETPGAADPQAVAPSAPLAGCTVAISAGGTREPLDPVRFLGNRSSGRQGLALARLAADRGATVHLAAANVEAALLADLPPQVRIEQVETTAELQAAMTTAAANAHAVIMAAAVADFRPASTVEAKIKTHDAEGNRRQTPAIELVANPDILAALVASRPPGQVVVGFAAETGADSAEVLEHGRAKARRKGADLLAVNRVGAGAGFGDVPNEVVILDSDGGEIGRAGGTKTEVAAGILDAIAARLGSAAHS
ncbi:bifunctional phosphopantothenoylcysteine decarboxylase/phosphopantothenate--cysteine ligase CoaBC [Pseudactinotalea sp. Z1732]|uniref:bifunctional phosphopantothenoylcysteine decarboxylase/phosphopantothenate--cysteine ligase CoaBC n=1 Tax=Micrococcales TaxID=85006 RepID=UPI003C7C89F6